MGHRLWTVVGATREMGHHIVLRHMCDIPFALRVETSGWVEGVGWGECGCGCAERKRLMGNTQGAKGEQAMPNRISWEHFCRCVMVATSKCKPL